MFLSRNTLPMQTAMLVTPLFITQLVAYTLPTLLYLVFFTQVSLL